MATNTTQTIADQMASDLDAYWATINAARIAAAPLAVRLRDLAPHLSHQARARLALDRIVDHAGRGR